MQHLVEAGVEADLAVVAEPTSLAVMPAHKGFAWVEAAFRGTAAHGSRPEVGVDAIRHASALLQEMDALEASLSRRTPHPLLGHGSFHTGTIQGGTAWSIYPESCVLRLERRTLPGEPAEGFLAEVEAALRRVQERIPDLDVALRLDMARPATEVPVDHALCQALLSALEKEDVPGRVEGMTAWVDAAFLNEAGIPAVCFGPGSIAQAHSADEWVDPREIVAAARVLERFLGAALSGS
jgi:acetylornithine deacetylase